MGSADSRQKTNEEAALWRFIARSRSRANRAAQILRSAKDALLRVTIHSDQLSARLKPCPDMKLESAPEATAKERNETWVTTGVLEA